jgi:glycosyltransferase involved in cell wall biosynthesis
MPRPSRISFVITGLSVGGAEMMLARLLSRLDRSRFSSSVTSLTDVGAAGIRIRELGIACRGMGWKRGAIPGIGSLLKLTDHLRAEAPDIVHTWMYHADLIGGLAARLAGRVPTIWSIRHGNLDRDVKLSTRLVARACALFSGRLPQRIVVCSRAAEVSHRAFGYDSRRFCYIPNGVDTHRFKPDPAAREEVRQTLKVPPNAPLIGHIGRMDPQKDHATFMRALPAVIGARPAAHVLMCGRGVDAANQAILQLADSAGLARERLHLLGERSDVERLLCGLDLLVSSSSSEAFPNVIAEAMACGVRCAATDVGETGAIIGDTGAVVPAKEPEALGAAIVAMLDGRERGDVRARILKRYDMGEVGRQYERLYDDVLQNAKGLAE